GAVALDAFLVSVLLGAQAALDVHLAPLAQVLAHDFRQAAEGLDPVPLGAFLVLAGLLVLPLLRGGDPDAADGHAAGRVADLGVGAEVADQDDLVDATSHVRIPCAVRAVPSTV